jgi:hypothetical protein
LPAGALESSCTDGQQSGLESDVDCGGGCGPCGVGQKCRLARDCISGRCGNAQCVERPLEAGEPIPPGYRVQMSKTDGAASTRTAGLLFLLGGYAGAYVAALSLPSTLGAMYVPVVGPWLTLKEVDADAGKVLIATDGALQGAGLVLLVGGLVGAGKQLLREPAEFGDAAGIHVAPRATAGGWGVQVFGRF